MTTPEFAAIRLPKTQRLATYVGLLLVATSGILWTLLHEVLQWGWIVSERRLLITHGVAAAIALIVVGGLLPLHVRLAFRVKRNLLSGAIALGVIALLAGTGVLLYYGDEESRDIVRWSHIGVGLLACLALPVHIWLGRRHRLRIAAARTYTEHVIDIPIAPRVSGNH